MRQMEYFYFQNNVNTGDGNSYTVNQASSVNIQILNPNSATFKCIVQGSLNGTDFSDLGLIVNLKDGSVTKTAGLTTTDIYTCDLTGLCAIRVKIDTASVNISVVGRFVD